MNTLTYYKQTIFLLILVLNIWTCKSQETDNALTKYSIEYQEYSDWGESIDEETSDKILLSCLINRIYIITHYSWTSDNAETRQMLVDEANSLKEKIGYSKDFYSKLGRKINDSSWNDYSEIQKSQIIFIEFHNRLRDDYAYQPDNTTNYRVNIVQSVKKEIDRIMNFPRQHDWIKIQERNIKSLSDYCNTTLTPEEWGDVKTYMEKVDYINWTMNNVVLPGLK
ncbi:hypothetical protein [Parabacteroides gordonii]|uniref:Uncharacterized protein n=1 Tax=Parabacteroides gordonii MS-1 = DSM 23371 TaxID=1203610 RepID=A0A0F5JBS2_9BACT|nr:hypothetical protein [Parabacteroides gordonii]KKB55158.1 hypothetical protein HMPREF1536_02615 [Parabacteroides gordonii MS-1 = DSM 23371]MCA5582039.1 hypothetical protein [Parabacteroides gordonii]